MRVLFVVHQIDYADHVAVGYLSAIAKDIEYKTYFCSLDRHSLLDAVRTCRPHVVAYSVNVIGFEDIVRENKAVSDEYEFVSILGGPQATFSPESFGESGMDYYCIGEGEYAFRDFLESIRDRTPPDDIPNIVSHKRSNSVRPLIKNLDDLPFPDRDLTLSNTHLGNEPKKTFYTTRGCPYTCTYCCNNKYNKLYTGKGKRIRRFSVERVIREITHVKKRYRMEFVKFGDDLFAFRADDWLREFAKEYKKHVGVPFNCYLRVDCISEDLLDLLRSAGCYSTHLSIDSTSELIRDKVLNRRVNKRCDMEKNIKLIHDYGINTWVNFMLAAPHSTIEDDLETIKLSRRCNITYTAYSTTVPMNGTTLYDKCIEEGMIDPSYRGDMTDCYKRSPLLCFSSKEKRYRYNIFLLGAILSKLPSFMDKFCIKCIPPNFLTRKLRDVFFARVVYKKIFKLS